MSSQPGQQTVAIHILPNISRNKDNLAMKFGQLIEYNMRNIFVENSYTKYAGIPRPLSKNSSLSLISGSTVKSFKQFVSVAC